MQSIENLSIFLDESGDLGFDWSKEGTSNYFIITLLVCDNLATVKAIKNAVKRTLKNKINTKSNKNRYCHEMKGGNERLPIKKYFYAQMPQDDWSLYSIILNKRRVYDELQKPAGKHKLYNFLAKTLIDHVPISNTIKTVSIIMDKCKKIDDIEDCNQYLCNQISSRLPSIDIILNIRHEKSHENPALQAVDLFCWGIARKYHVADTEWYDCFRDKIRQEEQFLW